MSEDLGLFSGILSGSTVDVFKVYRKQTQKGMTKYTWGDKLGRPFTVLASSVFVPIGVCTIT